MTHRKNDLPDDLMLEIWKLEGCRSLILAESNLEAEKLGRQQLADLIRAWLLRLIQLLIRRYRIRDPEVIETLACRLIAALRMGKGLSNFDSQRLLMPFLWGIGTKLTSQYFRQSCQRPFERLKVRPRIDISEDPFQWACRDEAFAAARNEIGKMPEKDQLLLQRKFWPALGGPRPGEKRWTNNETVCLHRILKDLRKHLKRFE